MMVKRRSVILSDLPTTDTTHFSGPALVSAGSRYAAALAKTTPCSKA